MTGTSLGDLVEGASSLELSSLVPGRPKEDPWDREYLRNLWGERKMNGRKDFPVLGLYIESFAMLETASADGKSLVTKMVRK